MLSAPDDVPGWISPEYGGGGVTVIGSGFVDPSGDDGPIGGRFLGPRVPLDPGLNPDALKDAVVPGTSTTQNDAAESIDSNFILIGAAVVLGVILLTSGND